MKPGMRRFSLAGLILAGIAFATSIIAGSIKIFQLLKLLTLKNPENVSLILEISVGVVIFGLALYALMAPDKVREFLTGRQVRYGSNSLVMSLAFIGILVVVNFLVYQKPQQWDVTESKEHTLAPETLGILSKIPEKVNATAFYSSQMSSEQAVKLLTDFKTNSNGQLEYQFIDPDLNPNAAIEAGITGDGKILLQMGYRKEIAAYADEQELTQALIRLIYPQERVVYFLTGHGERDSQDGSEESITKVSQTLESKNYTVKTLNLKAVNQVPEDAKVVIIAGPKKQVSAEEITLIEAYLDKGGALVVMEDPLALTDFGDQADPLAKDLEEKWGIAYNNDFII
ncbi:MAG: GldG family protein, partial [Anaerolineales bacterium]|nr:GldG family protein [Anaerolineales bacterium]